jgi:isoleucyl-tRNA synthetase
VPAAELVALDRFAIERARQLQAEVIEAYRDYEFHLIYQKVHNFCVLDLGGFWLDILKDRLYTTPARPAAALGADRAVARGRGDGALARADPVVHRRGDLAAPARPARRVGVPVGWWELPDVHPSPGIDWEAVLALKVDVARELERLRAEGRIGAPLEAEVDVYLDGPTSRPASAGSARNCASC